MAGVGHLSHTPHRPAFTAFTEGAQVKSMAPRHSPTYIHTTDPPGQEQPLLDRKQRKSVAFSEDTTIMDANGDISESVAGGEKTTAESHSGMASNEDLKILLTPHAAPDKAIDEVTDMFAGMNKKKKKPAKPKAEAEDAVAPDAEAPAPAPVGDGEVDLSTLKKKKKKSTKPKAEGDFDAKLEAAGVEEGEAPDTNGEAKSEQHGDPTAGTGIWAHDSSTPISYNLLLDRFFKLVNEHNPDILSSATKSYKIPPPQCLREGNKKTIFANIPEISARMKREQDHVTQFLFAELGTSGSVDGSKRLVIKGRFQQKQIENVLRRYIIEYVTCKTCRSPDTKLEKGENRLSFVTCNSCGSRRSVQAIRSGFTAQVGKRKRMQG